MQATTRWKRIGAAVAGGALALSMAATPAFGQEKDQIRIVGSSTVYPFSSYVAEELGKTTDYATPVVESTGSGGGHKLFGVGDAIDTPDLTNSSRKMKVSEFKRAKSNGVTSITEAVIGYDGIAVAQNRANDPIDLTREQLTLAVAAKVPQNGKLVDNPYTNWSQIDSALPNRRIVIYGPPATSGTRDAFEELVMEHASEHIDGYDGEYTKIRQDGVYVPSGENDNLIVQKLENNTDAFGVFGYSFLDENTDKIQGASIEGTKPTPDAISSGAYPISRSLFFYIKNSHRGKTAGLNEFVELFMSEKMIGPYGYLKDIGLIPLPQEMREASRQRVLNASQLTLKGGKLTTLKDYANGNE